MTRLRILKIAQKLPYPKTALINVLPNMTKTIYIETSIIGYLTARPTKNLIVAANTELTRDWWET